MLFGTACSKTSEFRPKCAWDARNLACNADGRRGQAPSAERQRQSTRPNGNHSLTDDRVAAIDEAHATRKMR
eukprot:3694184-Pleurochrysis_carterae.AAC.1